MSYRPLPRFSQTRQPQGAVEVDWSSPLTRGLVFATASHASNAVTKTACTIQAANGEPTPYGLGLADAGSTFRIDTGVNTFPSGMGGERTFAFLGRFDGSGGSGYGRLMGKGSGEDIIRNDSSILHYTRPTSGTSQSARSAINTLAVGNYYLFTVAVPQVGTAPRIFNFGQELGYFSQAAGTGTASANTSNYFVGNRGASDRSWDGVLIGTAFWDRLLTDAEIAEFRSAEAFWQIFRAAPRRLYVQVGGGPATHELAGDTVGEGETTGAIGHTPAATYSIAGDTVGEGVTGGAISVTVAYTLAGATAGEGVTAGAISVAGVYSLAGATSGEGLTTGAISLTVAHVIAGDTFGVGATAGAIALGATYSLAGATAGEGVTSGAITVTVVHALAGATEGVGVTAGAISMSSVFALAGATVGEGVTTGSLTDGDGVVWYRTGHNTATTRRAARDVVTRRR